MGNVTNPPEAGTVNSSIMSDRSPVKYYTEGLLSKNEYDNNTRFVPPDKSLPLRPAADLDTTTVNSLTPVDLPEDRKKTLRDYMSARTISNAYPLDSQRVENLSLTDRYGNPVSPGVIKNDTIHVPFNYIQSRGVDVDIKRGKETSTSTVDGNTLLKNATDEAVLRQALGTVNPSSSGGKLPQLNLDAKVSKPISDYYSKSVIYNRFNQNGQNYEEQAAPNQTTRRGEFVRPSNNFQQFALKYEMGTSEANRDVTFARLAQVGNSLSLRSGFELNAFEGGNNPTSPSSASGALLPGMAQLGLRRIERDRLNAKSVLEELTAEGIDEDVLIDPAGLSWGNLNNVSDQFAGLSNSGMRLLAIALIAALAVAIAITSVLFLTGIPTMSAADDLGRRPFGTTSYEVSARSTGFGNFLSNLSLWRLLGVPPTKNPLAKCLPVGALSFFGVDADAGVLGAALQTTLSVSQSPGYYSVLAREVNRSFLLIGDSFRALGRAFASGGALSGINQIGTVVETLRNSKFLRVVNVFSRRGDQILRYNSIPSDKSFDSNSQGVTRRFVTDIDQAPDRGYIGKGRVTVDGSVVNPLTLSWSSYRAADMFIVPSGYSALVYGSRAMNSHNIYASVPEGRGGLKEGTFNTPKGDSNRISSDDREAMETYLDAEYMPFYIHDVRTNEIISFHAFLASLAEDYTAAYDNVEAIGRIDAVKIYKSTARKLNFSFYIAATSESDFDSMWLKINKLTTMVYPQFSRGDLLSSNSGSENQLVMPFSQLVQAPPMVRVKIGDLVKSNYSRFNLARLFGYGDKKVNIDGVGALSRTIDDVDNAYSTLINDANSVLPGSTFTTAMPLSRPSTKLNSLGIAGNENPPGDGIILPRGLVLRFVEFEGKTDQNDPGNRTCVVEVDVGDQEETGLQQAQINEIAKLHGKPSTEAGTDTRIIGKKFLFKFSHLIPTPKTSRIISEKRKDSNMADYASSMSEFMFEGSDANRGNAIAKSFRSSGGKGLAGFIESMAFDWYDKVTWETEPGRRAPKFCKVTISFAPVHDITPGLDHRGVNRAPIYSMRGKI